LVFVDPLCGPCHTLQPEIANWMTQLAGVVEVLAVTTGPLSRNRDRFDLIDASRVLLQKNDEVATRFGFGGTPSAVVVSGAGTIQSAVARGGDEIRGLVGRTLPPEFVGSTGRPSRLGDPVPLFSLESQSGDTIGPLGDDHRPLLIIFLDRGASKPEQQARLVDLERRLSRARFRVIWVLSGPSTAETDAFRSPSIIDSARALHDAFGIPESPAAALVGRAGLLSADIALGMTEVTNLVIAADVTSRTVRRLRRSDNAVA
jgi:thiol-disulfide isomerase/thioredoxin